MLSPNLEKTLREAYQLATNNKHEYVTLEHFFQREYCKSVTFLYEYTEILLIQKYD